MLVATNNIYYSKKITSFFFFPFEQEPVLWELVCNKAKTTEL